MTISPTTLIAQTIKLTTPYTFTVKDQYDPVTARTITINPSGTKYYRIAAAPNGDATASTATTEEAGVDLLNHITQRMNDSIATNVWAWTLSTNGFAKLTYTGTGTGTIFSWDAGSIIRNLLGFTGSSISPALGTNAFVLGTYQPTHCVFVAGRETDSPHKHQRQTMGTSKTRGGRVSAWKSGKRPTLSEFDSVVHPTTLAYQTALALYSTPVEPERDPITVTVDPGVSPPWSMLDFMGTAHGHACGILPGTFQNEVAGTATAYDLAYLLPESREENVLIESSYLGQQRVNGLKFSLLARGTL